MVVRTAARRQWGLASLAVAVAVALVGVVVGVLAGRRMRVREHGSPHSTASSWKMWTSHPGHGPGRLYARCSTSFQVPREPVLGSRQKSPLMDVKKSS